MRRWMPLPTRISSSLLPRTSTTVGSSNSEFRFQPSRDVQEIGSGHPLPFSRNPCRRRLASSASSASTSTSSTSTTMTTSSSASSASTTSSTTTMTTSTSTILMQPNGMVLLRQAPLICHGNSYPQTGFISRNNILYDNDSHNGTKNREWRREKHGIATNPTATPAKNNSTPATTTTTTPTTTTTTATTIESKWRDMTDRILELPVGSFDQGRWNEAVTVLTHWFGNGGRGSTANDRGVAAETCWQILDRLCLELEADPNRSRRGPPMLLVLLSTTEVLNPILILWRDGYTDVRVALHRGNRDPLGRYQTTRRSGAAAAAGGGGGAAAAAAAVVPQATRSLPSQISSKLRWYETHNLVRMDTASHAIILDVAGKHSSMMGISRSGAGGGPHHNHHEESQLDRQQHDHVGATKSTTKIQENKKSNRKNEKERRSHHREGVWFADRYLRDWIDDYNKTTASLSKNDIVGDNKSNNRNNNHHQQRLSKHLQSQRIPARPDIVAFGTVIHAWVESGLPDAPTRAEQWLEAWDEFQQQQVQVQQQQQRNKSGEGTTSPALSQGTTKESKRNMYTFILLAWARAGDPLKVRKWMDRMIQEGDYPDVRSFNCLLMAYQTAASMDKSVGPSNNRKTNPKSNAECAEDVLMHMQQLYHDKDGFLSEPPSAASYNIVIDAWTKQAGSGAPYHRERALDAARRAHDWMERMKVAGIPLDTITYNTVITAYSRAGHPLQSEKVLEEMITAYQHSMIPKESLQQDNVIDGKPMDSDNTRDDLSFDNCATMTTTKPDVQSFTSVLAGWARVGTFDAAKRAEELLRVMQRPDVDIRPNVETFGACIHCWARAAAEGRGRRNRGRVRDRDQQTEAVQHAEALFREMRDTHNIQPDVYAYTGLLNAYGRSGRAQMAHDFLETCLREYDETKDPQMKPTVVTFTAILNAWSKAKGDPDAARKAHRLLHRMKDRYGIQPNAFSYSTVLDAYARSTLPDAADKALRLFHDMRDVAGLEPNAYTCTNVLKAMARGGRVEEAEALLYELIHDKSTTVKLGAHAFSSVLYGWSKSKRKDAPERAEELLFKMQEFYRRGAIDGPPNAVCCNNVLACWAHSELPGAAQRAEDLLRHIEQQQEHWEHYLTDSDLANSRKEYLSRLNVQKLQELSEIRCNRIMYNTVMNAWANQGNFSKTNLLYRELCNKSKVDDSLAPPDEWTYRALWKAIVKSNQIDSQEKIDRMQKVMKSMSDDGLELSKMMEDDFERIRQQQHRVETK